jgi:hypothetical protein
VNDLSRYPSFSVLDVQGTGRNLALVGTVDSTSYGRETWVGDRHLGYLFRKRPVLYGRWHSLEGGWKFSVSQILDSLVVPRKGDVIDVLDGYWGERAELVLDDAIEWKEGRYEKPEDHTHCIICWKAISAEQNSHFMFGDRNTEMCMECFGSYVIPRSLGFIPAPQQ